MQLDTGTQSSVAISHCAFLQGTVNVSNLRLALPKK